ncbi:uncharacterized protein LOC62_05G007719 [Vanrija pseudolonga]|uniref:Uncharacterized protein n=1 Tax=Vanrija pseudolonga TaxID=143232 RepID=A0AAF0YCG4_9TREE|nr:hypothetical protein LOC62_05G007719 [Vanrija pseudolonga]
MGEERAGQSTTMPFTDPDEAWNSKFFEIDNWRRNSPPMMQIPPIRHGRDVYAALSDRPLDVDFAVAVVNAYVWTKQVEGLDRETIRKRLAFVEREVLIMNDLRCCAHAFATIRDDHGLGFSPVLTYIVEREGEGSISPPPSRRGTAELEVTQPHLLAASD